MGVRESGAHEGRVLVFQGRAAATTRAAGRVGFDHCGGGGGGGVEWWLAGCKGRASITEGWAAATTRAAGRVG
jgi:hypothetical protein